MVSITAVIITLNEERNIERCIRSLRSIADEIIVVDSFSTDRTEEICRTLGVRFVQHKFEGYLEQKNYAWSLAAHDYVLSIDADEELSEPLRKSILEAKQNPMADGYTMNRLNNYCGQWIKHCGWYPDKKLRLAKKNYVHWGGENPHDKLLLHPGGIIRHLSGDLLHYSFSTHEEYRHQQKKFAEISAASYFKRGKRVSFLYPFLSGALKFLRNYFLNRGFLDGAVGWRICTTAARATFLKYKKLRELSSGK
ncbi:MAG TPA: glycosyltransferase family 2 protein [Bacteroidia bacterium]|nr:glycosyltransferase family 2 protein [Bacteroidia bacterium]